MTDITEHLRQIHERISIAARTAGRDSREVALVAVSKGHPSSAIEGAREAGLVDFGENYVQEALPKVLAAGSGCTWHFIGRLQANKTRSVAERFDWVQSVTSARLADRLSQQRSVHAPSLQVCLQLASERAPERGGIAVSELAALADHVTTLPKLVLRGLMFLPPPGLDTEALAAEFARARDVFGQLQSGGRPVDTLSMGMSADLELAIRYGSTMLRIGTALFGPRPSNQQQPGGDTG